MIEMIIQGGWFMVPLMLCSILGVAIVLDRWLYLRSARQESEKLLGAVDALVAKKDVDGIESLCRGHGGLLAAIFVVAVEKYRQLQDEPNLDFIQAETNKVMEDASILNTADLERRMPLLSTIGNVAPLFGFAGTVTGMMSAFEQIAATANPSAQTVAGGIREALITTAAGLTIAIPVVMVHGYITGQIDQMNTRTEETANGLVDMLIMKIVESRREQRKGG
jgi:biopolymer transport protein ExbB